MRDRGVLIGTAGRHSNVLKIRPPLVFGPAHVGLAAEAFAGALAATA
jgi:4-aminobutyrate aminotransferase-like enzyme